MAKSMTPARFIGHVVNFMDRQLKEFDPHAHATLNPFYNRFYVKVFYEGRFHILSFSDESVIRYQRRGPYALDREMWNRLFDRGLYIPVKGRYLTMMYAG